jgi:hypothetical protein
MQVEVYDTYVVKKDGDILHFDVLVPEGCRPELVYDFGKSYLKTKGLENLTLTAQECTFCDMEQIPSSIELDIKKQGYHIIELDGY